jgi:riboflavin kinase / FMN adenylyltransferase
MIVLRSFETLRREKNSVVSVGTFDGIHLAHQEIIREVVHRARMREGRSVVVTFDPHPKEVVTSARGPVQLLSTLDDRIALLDALHVDTFLVIPFTWDFSRMGAEEFYRSIIDARVGVSEVVVGYDHMFGRDREAGTAALMALGRDLDFSVFAVHPMALDGEPISSTRIRRALGAGDVLLAERMLGYSYQISGTVAGGDRRGRTLGFPTANLDPEASKKVVPGNGVYLVRVSVGADLAYGIMNIGVRPTVSAGVQRVIEVHILDFSRDIYGERIAVTFLRRLRDEKKFGSVQELVEQLNLDRDHAYRTISSLSYSPTQRKE